MGGKTLLFVNFVDGREAGTGQWALYGFSMGKYVCII